MNKEGAVCSIVFQGPAVPLRWKNLVSNYIIHGESWKKAGSVISEVWTELAAV